MIRKEKLEELHYLMEQMKAIRIEKKQRETSFLKGECYDCQLNNGAVIKREKLLKNNKEGSAAIILPMVGNDVILIVEPRVFSKRTVGISFPAGYIEENENPEVAALRELQEEVGYTPESLIHLGGYYQDMGCSAAYNECFLAKNCKKTSEQSLDKDEFIKYFHCTFEEMLELIDQNYIQDGNAIVTVQKLLRRKDYGCEKRNR